METTTYIIVAGFIIFDIVTGIIKALYQGGLDSTKLRKGLFHKLSEIVTVGGCGLLEFGSQYVDIGFDIPVLKPVATYICAMELISIIENVCEVNEPLRKLFMPYLSKLKDVTDKELNDEQD